jgi:hypothetical protein
VADGERDLVEVFVDDVPCGEITFPPDDRDGSLPEPLAGRLLRRIDRWKRIGAESIIRNGLSPEWKDQPPSEIITGEESPPLTGEKNDLMIKEIQKECQLGVIKEVPISEAKLLLRIFLFPKKNGEWRKILDCTILNDYCTNKRFKMEDHRLVAQLLKPQMWCVTADIKSAYHHVTIDSKLSPYLCFGYNGKYYQYVGMPFGIKMAPRVFSRILHRATVVIRHQWCVEIVQYIDDIWIGH